MYHIVGSNHGWIYPKEHKYKMLIAASPTQHATLWSKSKDWLTRNQDKMFQCRGISIR